MKKKSFAFLLTIVLLGMTGLFYGCTEEPEIDENYVMASLETRIDLGLGEEFTVLHTSDTHLTLASLQDTASIRKLAKGRKTYFNNAVNKLAYVSKLSREKQYPIVHSGDLIDFISVANLQYANSFLCKEGNDILAFAAGNHEYCQYVGDGRDEDAAYRNESLDTIQNMSVNDCRFFATERNGVTFISIDNSYHQFEEEQLEALKNTVKGTSNPVVLLMHAPLYEESLYTLMTSYADSAYLMAVPEEKMTAYTPNRIREQKASETTQNAYDYIVSEPKIRVILAGHIHQNTEVRLSETLVQYTVDPDHFRKVTFY